MAEADASPSALPLPWLAPVLQQVQALHKAHAVLLQGAAGDGLFEAATAITHAWLCEADTGPRPCGRCEACRLLAGQAHADLFRLLPEELRLQLGGPAAGDAGDAAADGEAGSRSRRKPSRQIRIDEVRQAVDWIVTTSSRGRAKVVLLHPAEALNLQSANALLKTLEEPPRGARLLLTASQPEQLLPTIRSRCQVLRLQPPTAQQACQWLHEQGLQQPEVLLAACSNRPLEARALHAAGIDAARWSALPAAVLAGQGAAFAGWPLPRVLDTLFKLCHDGLLLAQGLPPRFFPPAALKTPAAAAPLADWNRELAQMARRIEHPWNEGLLIEALLQRARAAWRGEAAAALSDTLAG